MKTAFLASDAQIGELLSAAVNLESEWIRAESFSELLRMEARAYVDLGFKMDPERIKGLAGLLPAPVFVHSVVHSIDEIGQPFIRVNAWNGFLNGTTIEAASTADYRDPAKAVMAAVGINCIFVEDQPGFVRARIISMIINEAYHAFGEGVSSKDEIDLAMRLGTGYPFGPFEWEEKIGLKNVYDLLSALQRRDTLYDIAPALADKIISL